MLPEFAFSLFLLASLAFAGLTAHRNLAEQQRQLVAKDRLIANVAHELKTPIATVGVALEAVERFGAGEDPTRRAAYVAIGRNELERLDGMAERAIESLRSGDLSKRLERTEVDLRSLTREAWRGLALRHGLDEGLVKFKVFEGEATTVSGDRHYLYHAVYNLLDNAVKYGGDPPSITVQINHDVGGFVEYTVMDNGGGIPYAERERIFEPFYRAERLGGHDIKGHGLGLSFVNEVARAHGGKASAGTHSNGGGWVCLEIPRHG